MTRRRILFNAWLIAPLVVIGACGGDDTESAPSSTSAAKTTTIGDSAPSTTNPPSTTTESAPPSTTATTEPAPPPPTNLSTLETAGVEANLLFDEVGLGSGSSNEFTPTGAVAPSQQGPGSMGIVRLRVEWACAQGSSATVVLHDGSGDISSSLENGFDGPIPVSHPPAWVVWEVEGSCSWHVRALDQ